MTYPLRAVLLALITACALPPAASAAGLGPDETELRQKLVASNWPADIVRLADQVLRVNPAAAWANEERRRAESTMRVLRTNDVGLFRPAFLVDLGSVEQNLDLHRAALGDPAAAMRIASVYRLGSNTVNPDVHRYVGWLQFAASLGNEGAAYELALHFRRQGQPLLAASYEARAINLKFGPTFELNFNGHDYLVSFALPNIYFHMTTAYALLRHNGLELGKKDFVG